MCEGCPDSGSQIPIGPQGPKGDPGDPCTPCTDGTNGVSMGWEVTTLNPGQGGCSQGGSLIEIGPDYDGDGLPDVITNSITICNPVNGTDYQFPFNPIVFVYDNPGDNTKFTQSGGTKGLGVGIYSGWAICNGNNGAQDLRGKFPVAYNDVDVTFSTIGNTGGEKSHTLTKAELPKHQHIIGSTDNGSISGGAHTHTFNGAMSNSLAQTLAGASLASGLVSPVSGVTDSSSHSHTGNTGDGSTDGLAGNSHNNLPPYFTLLAIQKI